MKAVTVGTTVPGDVCLRLALHGGLACAGGDGGGAGGSGSSFVPLREGKGMPPAIDEDEPNDSGKIDKEDGTQAFSRYWPRTVRDRFPEKLRKSSGDCLTGTRRIARAPATHLDQQCNIIRRGLAHLAGLSTNNKS